MTDDRRRRTPLGGIPISDVDDSIAGLRSDIRVLTETANADRRSANGRMGAMEGEAKQIARDVANLREICARVEANGKRVEHKLDTLIEQRTTEVLRVTPAEVEIKKSDAEVKKSQAEVEKVRIDSRTRVLVLLLGLAAALVGGGAIGANAGCL